MVKKSCVFAVLAVVLVFFVVVCGFSFGQTRVYRFNHQWAKIWINQDGTIDLFYNVSLTLDSGQVISYVTLGQPKSDFKIGQAYDQFGYSLDAAVSSDGTGVKVTLHSPLTAGSTVWFTVITNVGGMISSDSTNKGNLGMQFAPEWQAVPISDVRVQIVLPSNVTVSDVKTPTNYDWNSTSVEPDGRLSVFWQTPVLLPNEQYLVGVSFPEAYLPDFKVSSGDIFFNVGLVAGLVGVGVVVLVLVFLATRKRSYVAPKVGIETLGIRRGLTAVEASYLLDLKPTQIVTEILYSLLQKRAVWVESANPSLKVKVLPDFQDKKGPEGDPLRYYEIDFLDSVRVDGSLDEEKLAKAVMYLRDTLEEKLRGYSRKDTVDYYRKIVDKAWLQVEQAGTDDVASKVYDEQLLWLLLDPNYRGRTQTSFGSRIFEPNPLWFWYWYGYTLYSPHPVYRPNIDVPAQSAKPPVIPGADFANNIATSMEKTAGNIVTSLERFANAIVPAKPVVESHQPTHSKADCVCACAACACACACVSCACACAGGGVG